MTDKNTDQIVQALSALNVLELSKLVNELKELWGVSDAPVMMAGGGMPAASGAASEPEEEKTDFKVVMVSAGASKMEAIKVIRALTGLGLKEAKEASEGSNVVLKEGVDKAAAEDAKKKLEAAGCTVKLD